MASELEVAVAGRELLRGFWKQTEYELAIALDALTRIETGNEDGCGFSGTDCAEIARNALVEIKSLRKKTSGEAI